MRNSYRASNFFYGGVVVTGKSGSDCCGYDGLTILVFPLLSLHGRLSPTAGWPRSGFADLHLAVLNHSLQFHPIEICLHVHGRGSVDDSYAAWWGNDPSIALECSQWVISCAAKIAKAAERI
jgi:hypothetical protein